MRLQCETGDGEGLGMRLQCETGDGEGLGMRLQCETGDGEGLGMRLQCEDFVAPEKGRSYAILSLPYLPTSHC